jgi:uroporphyrinogen-III synthase
VVRVLVTRGMPEAEETARALLALGHEAVLAPLRVCVPEPGLWPEFLPEALIATSRHAFGSPLPEAPAWYRLPLFAVGGETGAVARAAGFTDIRIGEGDAAALVRLILAETAQGAALLYFAGLPRQPLLETVLTRAGRHIIPHLRYRMLPVPALPEAACHAIATGSLDAVLHFSSETARLFCTLAAAAGLAAPVAGLRHICLSAAIADVIGKVYAGQAVLCLDVAPEPNTRSLMRVLQAGFTGTA